MDKQKTGFFLTIGLAVLIVGAALLFNKLPAGWLGSPNLEATRVALRSTEVAVEATTSALQGTVTPETVVSRVLAGKRTWNGLQIEVLNVEPDAWPLIQAYNRFNEPPLPGKRMLLITLRVKKVAETGEEAIAVHPEDFKVIGERGEAYTTYGKETRCGIVPDALDGVVTNDRQIEGTICVQVPEEERGLTLIYEPYAGDQPAVYIPLPE
ncbi:MAG: DUF4352 domain-containing protein [Chloroflexi bacterium]|nr:MAG: DUF4352 domain-containing protein [Chloroflexota bacterium]